MIHIVEDILKKRKYTILHSFVVALEKTTSLEHYKSDVQFFLEIFVLCLHFTIKKTHLECFSLLANVSIKLLCVFAVSGQLWGYVQVLIL